MEKGIRIKLDDPGITSADEEAALRVLRSGQLVRGPACAAFEEELRKSTRRKHAIVVSSGTTALVAVMKALGIGADSTVVVPALTFPAPASAAAFLGAEVLACDVDPESFCISPETLAPVLDRREKISLVVAIDQFGMPAPAPALEQMLRPRGIPLLVDAACSQGSRLLGKPCGSFGAAAIFSFHPRKVVTSGEGGAVLTDYKQVASRVRQIANHGLEDGEFASTGINLRLPEVSAAIGLSQTRRLRETIERRRALAARYIEALPLAFQKPPPGAQTNYQTLVAVLPEPMGPEERSFLVGSMRDAGIEIAPASYCLGAIPAIRKRLGLDLRDTPVALGLSRRAIALPLHAGLADIHVDEAIQLLQNWLRKHVES